MAGHKQRWSAPLLHRDGFASVLTGHLGERDGRIVPGVAGLEKCFVRKMGFEYYVDIHVEVDGDLTVRRGHDIAHDVKTAIRKANPRVTDVLVHIEPQGVKHE